MSFWFIRHGQQRKRKIDKICTRLLLKFRRINLKCFWKKILILLKIIYIFRYLLGNVRIWKFVKTLIRVIRVLFFYCKCFINKNSSPMIQKFFFVCFFCGQGNASDEPSSPAGHFDTLVVVGLKHISIYFPNPIKLS